LRETGFVEGTNVVIDRRFAEGRLDRYNGLVTELVQLGADVLVTSNNAATLAAKRAATNIPIVMMNVSDPVGQGIIPSLARPGGSITGVIQDDLVSLADKTHNAEAILFDYRVLGDSLWDRFNGGADGTRWYYGELANCFALAMPGALSDRLSRAAQAFSG
jgi:ABC-type uncharacterized transport system substrate-binding protein